MTRNPTRTQSRRPGVEVFEPRCLLSALDPIADLAPEPAGSTAAQLASSTATTAQDAIIGASAARQRFGLTGAGLTAAVIDTGVNYNHPAFGGGLGTGGAVVVGRDFAQGDSDPMPSGTSHGTGVAGIIASRDPAALGVAPGAQIAALRVFGDDGSGSFDRIADALQWVVDNHGRYNITVVNLSISDGKNYLTAPTLFAAPVVRRIIDLVDRLETLNIPVVTAAGNNFSGQQGMGFTAIVDDTISVTGSDGPNRLAPDAQRLGRAAGGASATDLLAPGRDVVAPWDGTSIAPLDGTSFAAPLVTGSVLLLQELYLKRFGTLPTVDQLEGWLRDSAAPVRDAATGITIGRLDVPAAAALVPSPAKPATGQPTGQGGKAGGGLVKVENPAPTPGGTSRPPSSPVAEPPAGSAGSGNSGSKPGNTTSPKPIGPSPATPPAGTGDGGSSPSGDPAPAPGQPPASGSPASPEETTPPASPEPTPPAEAPSAPPATEPPPASTPPASGDSPAGEPQPVPPPPTSGIPTNDLPPAPPSPDPQPPADEAGPKSESPVPVVVPVDLPPAVPGQDDEDEDGPAADDPGDATPSPTAPARDEPAGPDQAPTLASLFGQPGVTLGVRAWSVSKPSASVTLSRAQFLRAGRATAGARLKGWRPIPASSRPFAAFAPRRSPV